MLLVGLRRRGDVPDAARTALAYAEYLGARVVGYDDRPSGVASKGGFAAARTLEQLKNEVHDASGLSFTALDGRLVVAVFGAVPAAAAVLRKAGFEQFGRSVLFVRPDPSEEGL